MFCNQFRYYHMEITVEFYTLSHDKFHDSDISDILYGINSTDIVGCWTPEHSVTTITYYPDWVSFRCDRLQKMHFFGCKNVWSGSCCKSTEPLVMYFVSSYHHSTMFTCQSNGPGQARPVFRELTISLNWIPIYVQN